MQLERVENMNLVSCPALSIPTDISNIFAAGLAGELLENRRIWGGAE